MRTERWGSINGANPHYGNLFLGFEQTYIVPFTFGTTLQGVGLQLHVMAAGFGNGDFTSSSIADPGHTANWSGFGDVRDSNGNIISNYTFSSGSGFNYALGITAVPEPNSCLLLMAAGTFGLFRRSRSSRSVDSAMEKYSKQQSFSIAAG